MTLKTIASTVTAAIFLATSLPAAPETPPSTPCRHVRATELPTDALKNLDGEQASLTAMANGKPVLLAFWSTRCALCAREVPRINKLSNDPRLAVIGINEQNSAAKARDFIRINGVTYPVLLDTGGATARALKVYRTPTFVILGVSGDVLYHSARFPESLDTILTQQQNVMPAPTDEESLR